MQHGIVVVCMSGVMDNPREGDLSDVLVQENTEHSAVELHRLCRRKGILDRLARKLVSEPQHSPLVDEQSTVDA